MTKTCSRCKTAYPLDRFQRDSSQSSGLKSRCKECCSNLRPRKRGESVRCPEVPLVEAGLGKSCLDELELGPAGIAPIAPTTAEEAHQAAPEGYAVKGVSTLYDGAGNVKQQWVKTNQLQADAMRALEAAIAEMVAPIRGASELVPAPQHSNEDLLCAIPIGDAHVGLYTWAVETGEDFNLEIAERNLFAAVDRLIDMAPPAATLLLCNLGDFLHGDDSTNRTAKSGHALDIDTRWSKVIGVAIRVKRRCIDRGLQKFGRVINWDVEGNHDPTSSVMLRHVMQALYEKEPRVTVDMTPGKFHYLRFGSNLIGATHGDTVKLPELAGIMACDRPQDWGETKYRHWYSGHVHHSRLQEHPGVIVESFRTLAPKDSWHAGQGYRSGQDLTLDVFHRRWGRINRHIIGIEQIIAEAA